MQRGLEGRRIALIGAPTDEQTKTRLDTLQRALHSAGAEVQLLSARDGDESWHGAKYAALVLADSDSNSTNNARLHQLVREFLVSDKPLGAFGAAVRTILEAGGVQGRTVSATGDLKAAIEEAGATCADEDIHVDEALITAREESGIDAFANRLVAELSTRLEERAVDEMSELSFPASDPPAVSPGSVGHLRDDRRAEG